MFERIFRSRGRRTLFAVVRVHGGDYVVVKWVCGQAPKPIAAFGRPRRIDQKDRQVEYGGEKLMLWSIGMDEPVDRAIAYAHAMAGDAR